MSCLLLHRRLAVARKIYEWVGSDDIRIMDVLERYLFRHGN
jgi:hypothetical protein